jgi:hypothetical protein
VKWPDFLGLLTIEPVPRWPLNKLLAACRVVDQPVWMWLGGDCCSDFRWPYVDRWCLLKGSLVIVDHDYMVIDTRLITPTYTYGIRNSQFTEHASG